MTSIQYEISSSFESMCVCIYKASYVDSSRDFVQPVKSNRD